MKTYLFSVQILSPVENIHIQCKYLLQAEQEEKEAEEMKKKLGCEGDDSLTALIQKRQASRGQQADSFLAGLEAKYAKPAKDKGKKSKRK